MVSVDSGRTRRLKNDRCKMVLLTVLMDFKLAIRASMRVRLVQMIARCKLLANEGCDDGDDVEAVRKRRE